MIENKEFHKLSSHTQNLFDSKVELLSSVNELYLKGNCYKI